MTDKYRTVYRVWHDGDFIGEYDARYYAESVLNTEEAACRDAEEDPCGMVNIQVVEINDETGEETDVT